MKVGIDRRRWLWIHKGGYRYAKVVIDRHLTHTIMCVSNTHVVIHSASCMHATHISGYQLGG